MNSLVYVFSLFVILLQFMEWAVSYSKVVYGSKEIKNPILIWLVVHFGFFVTYLLTRGLLILLFCLFVYFCSSYILTIFICFTLFTIYACLLAK